MKAIIHQIRRVSPMLLLGAIVVLTAAKSKMCVPTPTELICEADSDCGGVPPVDCIGAWACVDGGCEFVCSVEPPPETCYSSDECGPGTHCSVDDGACDPMPGCGFDGAGMAADPIACPAVCVGQCVPNEETPCWSDYDCPDGTVCKLNYNYDGGTGADAAMWCPPCDDPTVPCNCEAPPMGVCVAAQKEICDGIDNDCDGLVDEGGVCGNECESDWDCPAGTICENMGGACPPCPPGYSCPCVELPGQCVPTGEPECVSDADCPAGFVCSVNEGDIYCPPCPDGEYCPMYCAAPVGVCILSKEEICDGHDNDGDGLIDEGGVCGGDLCIDDMDCPDGFVCDYMGCPPCPPGAICPTCLVAAGQCVPASNGDCMSDSECGPGMFCSVQGSDCLPCKDPNQPCPMICMAPIGTCLPYSPEVCDGLDNDGDGMVDEGGVCGTSGQCNADFDCGPGEICQAVDVCWDECDPNGNCWGGCGIEFICTAP